MDDGERLPRRQRVSETSGPPPGIAIASLTGPSRTPACVIGLFRPTGLSGKERRMKLTRDVDLDS
jgi:hypothetical protein